MVVSNGRDADLEELVVLLPNTIPRGPSLQDVAKHRHLIEQRLAKHAVRIGVAGDGASGFIDDGHDVWALAAASCRILEPLGNILSCIERAAPAIGLARRCEDVPHVAARRAVRNPFRETGPIGAPRPREKLRIVPDTLLELSGQLCEELGPHHEIRSQPHEQHDDEVARNQLQAHVATLLMTPNRLIPPFDQRGYTSRARIITVPFGTSSSCHPKARSDPMFGIDP